MTLRTLGFFHKARTAAGRYGVAEAGDRLLEAILSYSSWERIIVWSDDEAAVPISGGRAEVRPALGMGRDVQSGAVTLLHHVGLGPAALVDTRGATPVPIYTSVFPALSYNDQLPQHMMERLVRKTNRDTDIYPSSCSRDVVQRIQRHLTETGFIKNGTPRSAVIPVGVDTGLFKPCPPEEKLVIRAAENLAPEAVVALVLTRFSPSDKADLLPLLRSIRYAADPSLSNLVFVLAGGDGYFGAKGYIRLVEKEIDQLGLREAVQLRVVNDRNRLIALLRSADLFASPADSVQETFGITPVEGMACGLPAIVSDWNGYRETVRHGDTGLLAPSGFFDNTAVWNRATHVADYRKQHLLLSQSVVIDTDAIVAGCQALARAPSERARMAHAARRHVETTYAWSKIIGRYEELWADAQVASFGRSRVFPTTLDYFATFGAYATRLYTDDDIFQLTDFGNDAAFGRVKLNILSDLSGALQLEALRTTLHEFQSAPASVNSLTMAEGKDLAATRFCVSWMAKNGLIRLSRLPEQDGIDDDARTED